MPTNLTELGVGLPHRDLSLITTILVHRIEDGETATEIAKFFRDAPEWTGGGMPYHIIIRRNGMIEQAVAFDRKAPGAVAANPVSIQVALVGDLLHHKATVAQEAALLDVCIDLNEWLGFDKAVICGHTDFPGASKDPKKVCPGPGIDLKRIRELTSQWACSIPKDEARGYLENYGYVFERK